MLAAPSARPAPCRCTAGRRARGWGFEQRCAQPDAIPHTHLLYLLACITPASVHLAPLPRADAFAAWPAAVIHPSTAPTTILHPRPHGMRCAPAASCLIAVPLPACAVLPGSCSLQACTSTPRLPAHPSCSFSAVWTLIPAPVSATLLSATSSTRHLLHPLQWHREQPALPCAPNPTHHGRRQRCCCHADVARSRVLP